MQLIDWNEIGDKGKDMLLGIFDVRRDGAYLKHLNGKRVRCRQCGRAVKYRKMGFFPKNVFLCESILCTTEYITKNNIEIDEEANA